MNDLIFNELSTQPYPADINKLNFNIKQLLMLCKTGKERYGFNKLRFVNQFHEILVMEGYTFQDFLKDPFAMKISKDLLLSFRRYPFIDDEDEEAINAYISKTFTYGEAKCSGLAGAYIYSTLATSIFHESEHPKIVSVWNEPKIKVTIEDNESTFEDVVYHISKEEHLNSDAIKEWYANKFIWNIEQIEDLNKLYPNYIFESEAFDDLMYWKKENKLLYIRLHILLKDVEVHPFTGGMGKTEALKGTSGRASKRLNDEHRIQYSLSGRDENKIITIYRCKEHY
jgi:Txe/YoeB family toxin of toxin-antitoxin system